MVIRWPRLYDLALKAMTLGRESRIRQKIIAAAALSPGQRVLDVGCGTGTLALAAATAVGAEGRVSGIDPSAEMIDRARLKASKAHADVDFAVGVIEALPYAEQSMDVVLATLVFHHLPDDALQRAGLSEIARVCNPGGRLVLVDVGKTERLAAEVQAAGFGHVTVTRMAPGVLFTLTAARV